MVDVKDVLDPALEDVLVDVLVDAPVAEHVVEDVVLVADVHPLVSHFVPPAVLDVEVVLLRAKVLE